MWINQVHNLKHVCCFCRQSVKQVLVHHHHLCCVVVVETLLPLFSLHSLESKDDSGCFHSYDPQYLCLKCKHSSQF